VERSESGVGVGNFGNVGVGVGYFTSDSATLAIPEENQKQRFTVLIMHCKLKRGHLFILSSVLSL